ncbi:MAG: ATP-binding protein [Candidatus Omnitrophica bacterium]|nr:ATP-binding protein [Candidatus Omnitrophota bacterium]
MFRRPMTDTIHERLKEKRKFILVILGPRQVGKTTAIHQVLKEIKNFHRYAAADLPSPPDSSWISREWEMIRAKTRKNETSVLVLDEVQKIDNWSVAVKRLWDEDTLLGNKIHVVILGSSSLLIQKGLTESLAGRFEVIRFPHWSWQEMHSLAGWSLDQYIYFGGYPAPAEFVKDEERWRQYILDAIIEPSISKDVLLMNRVEKPALLRQLFALSCEYAGQILSYNKILGQLTDAGNTVTLSHYQNLLEGAFLIKGLQKWSGNMLRLKNSSPKWIPLNPGLRSAIAKRSFPECKDDPVTWGRMVESAVGATLVNTGAPHGIEVLYWRDGNLEVDFVIKKGVSLTAVEVKTGRKRLEFSGLEEFKKRNPKAKTIVVGPGGISLKEFFETPVDKLLV